MDHRSILTFCCLRRYLSVAFRGWKVVADVKRIYRMHVLGYAMGIFFHQVLGAMWYGPFMFGNLFMKLAYGAEASKKVEEEPDRRAYVAATIGTLIAIPAYAVILEMVGASTVWLGLGWGLVLSLVVAGLDAPHGWFEERPFELFLLHQGYHTVSLILLGSIYGHFFITL